jgi:hypothetical protein
MSQRAQSSSPAFADQGRRTLQAGVARTNTGMNVTVDAVITRSLNKAETVPGQVGMPDRDESRVAEHPAVGTEDLPLQSSSKVGLWSKKTLVEQEAQRDGS